MCNSLNGYEFQNNPALFNLKAHVRSAHARYLIFTSGAYKRAVSEYRRTRSTHSLWCFLRGGYYSYGGDKAFRSELLSPG